jgi:hypothetical protein
VTWFYSLGGRRLEEGKQVCQACYDEALEPAAEPADAIACTGCGSAAHEVVLSFLNPENGLLYCKTGKQKGCYYPSEPHPCAACGDRSDSLFYDPYYSYEWERVAPRILCRSCYVVAQQNVDPGFLAYVQEVGGGVSVARLEYATKSDARKAEYKALSEIPIAPAWIDDIFKCFSCRTSFTREEYAEQGDWYSATAELKYRGSVLPDDHKCCAKCFVRETNKLIRSADGASEYSNWLRTVQSMYMNDAIQ